MKKRQRPPYFNDWYTFKLLLQHLEPKVLQTYEKLVVAHWLNLQVVECY